MVGRKKIYDTVSTQLALYRRRKEAGICVACGTCPPEYPLARCRPCADKHTIYRKRSVENRPDGICSQCCKRPTRPNRSDCDICSELGKVKSKNKFKKARIIVLEKLGGKCVCCGSTNIKYFQLDHVENDGASHRRKMNNAIRGSRVFTWLIKNNYPEGFQILCANCHQAKSFYGGCTNEDHDL